MKLKTQKIIALIIVIIVFISMFSVLFSFIGDIYTISSKYSGDIEGEGPGEEIRDVRGTSTRTFFAEGRRNSDSVLFEAEGANNTRYLKSIIGIEYDGYLWRYTSDESRDYYWESVGDIESVSYDVDNYEKRYQDNITIHTETIFEEGFIPISTYTDIIYTQDDLEYYEEGNIFYLKNDVDPPSAYRFTTSHYKYNLTVLRDSETIDDDSYLQLPDSVTMRVENLAEEITEDYDNPFDKANAIEEYLKDNYTYNYSYRKCPTDQDIVDWFLFEEEQGVCANFNSAFVVLARAAGIPTRMVKGFKIDSNTMNRQDVTGRDAHSWGEIGLECGWIKFDATPGTNCDNCVYEQDTEEKTETEIDLDIPKETFPNQTISLEGELTETIGDPISDEQISIEIDSKGSSSDEYPVLYYPQTDDDGNFDVEHYFTEVGNYSVNASFEGNENYLDSSAEMNITVTNTIIDVGTDPTFIRNGDEEAIQGKVRYEGEPVNNERVEIDIIDFDEGSSIESSSTNTEENGDFEITYSVKEEDPLGKGIIEYRYPSTGYVKEQNVYFKARTNLTIETEVKEGAFRIDISLKDDMGNDLADQQLNVFTDYPQYGMSGDQEVTTDKDGNASIVIEDPPEELINEYEIEVVYHGSDSYVGSSDSINHTVSTSDENILNQISRFFMDYWYLLLLIALISGSLGYGYKNGYIFRFRRRFSRWIESNSKEQSGEVISKKRDHESIKIEIPQIKENLPNVWDTENELTVQIQVDDPIDFDEIKVYIENELKDRFSAEEGRDLKFDHRFSKKGKYEIKVKTSNGREHSSTFKINIVDYRKEIHRKYSDFVDELKGNGFDIQDNDTPLEIEEKLAYSIDDKSILREIRNVIEKAKYSSHEIERQDYEELMFDIIQMEENFEE